MKIAVLEDHRVFAESFKTYLEINKEVTSVDLFFNIDEFESDKSNYDLTILDLDINGNSSLHLIKKYQEMKFLILTANNSPNLIRKAYEDGVYGYLLKKIGCHGMFNNIRKIVYKQEKIYENSVVTQSFRQEMRKSKKLTKREIEIVELLFNDHSESYIANRLCVSINTVKSHKQNIFKKLEIQSTAEVKYNYLFK
ncbi:MAG: DNA-binding response regulator [Chlorobiota bacterium]